MSATTTPDNAETQARLLSEALPFMQKYENKTVVVKYGGHAMATPISVRPSPVTSRF